MSPRPPRRGPAAFLQGLSDAVAPLARAVGRYLTDLLETAEVFRRLIPLGREGWAISTYGMVIDPEAHADAGRLTDSDPVAGALRLEECWSDPVVHRRVCSLVPYAYPPEQRAIALRRQALLMRAAERLADGLYEEAVLLLYSQLDGLFQDRADLDRDPAYAQLFSRRGIKDPRARQFEDVVADSRTMVSTEREFFLAVRHALSASVTATTLGDDPSRHGVLHGRVLGYGTRQRGAQGFAFLAACLEVLIASYEFVPLTEEEKPGSAESMTEGMAFILKAKAWSPVRSVYVSAQKTGQGTLVTMPEDPGPESPEALLE